MHIRYLSEGQQAKVESAFELAKESHKNQDRASGEPYFVHPVSVAIILAGFNADYETIIAALLHDTVEDTDLTLKEIEERFDYEVSRLVNGVTKLGIDDMTDSISTDEQIENLRKIFTLMQSDVRIMLIKLADRMHNAHTEGFLPKERQIVHAKEIRDVFVKIANRLCMRDMRDEFEEISMKILDPKQLEELRIFRMQNESRGEIVMDKMQKCFGGMDITMKYEHKTLNKLKVQMDAGGSSVTGVSTLNVILVCKDMPTCYKVLGILHMNWSRELHSFDDYINSPQICGYRGLHTTIIMEDGTRVRCKIRTRDMDCYAHKGVATKCFDSKAKGVTDYLPWVEHISSLSKDTEDRSEEFWPNLQSDILGDSIVVYTDHDKEIQVPKDSTALDGAFYCFGDRANRIKKIRVNGEEVSFGHALERGVSMDVDLSSRPNVMRDWLKHVNTGISQAYIRSGLARKSNIEKAKLGKSLLQEIMIENRKGLIEEYSDQSLIDGVKILGFDTLDDASISIFEGKMEPITVYNAIFNGNSEGVVSGKECSIENGKKNKYKISFNLKKDDMVTMNKLFSINEKFNLSLRSLSMSKLFKNSPWKIDARVLFSKDEREAYKSALNKAGISNTKVISYNERICAKIAVPVLSLLWGLDCLLGKKLIIAGVSPYDLTFLRFAVLLIFSFAYIFVVSKFTTKGDTRFKWIYPFNKNLLFAGVAVFITALSSYIAVQQITALSYSMCMNIGIAALLVYKNWSTERRKLWMNITALALILSTLLLLFVETGSLTNIFAVAGIGCGIGFALYSSTSSKYQLQESVQSRYLMFILYYSFVAFVLSVPLVCITSFELIKSSLFWPSLAFVTFLTALPYVVYFELLKYESVKVTWSYVPLFLIIITIGEVIFYGNIGWELLLPSSIAALWYLFYRA